MEEFEEKFFPKAFEKQMEERLTDAHLSVSNGQKFSGS